MRLSDYTQSGGRGLFRRDRRLYDQRGTYTFTIPEGVTQIWAFVMGAGGGAHRGESWHDGIIAGGAGGGYASGIISGLTPGNTLTITVGSGGIGQISGVDGEGELQTVVPTAGGDSTVVGGSTTYLLGEGGEKGIEKVETDEDGTFGEGKGGGGTAATSSVTDAYTAAGGGSGTTTIAADVIPNNEAQCESRVAAGGGASGSPFGTGMNGGKAGMLAECNVATGGGGWTQKDYQHLTSVQQMPQLHSPNDFYEGFPWMLCLCGYGSHHPPSNFYMNGPQEVYSNQWAGGGRTAKGGMGMTELSYSEVGDTSGEGGSRWVPNYHTVMTAIHGEDGNPNWWFPWEIDGGGGGGAYARNKPSMFVAGNGAPGGGGGGMCMSNTGNSGLHGSIIGGSGGFGGGGGGCMAALEYNEAEFFNAHMVFVGGKGGNGGGGGSVLAPQGGGHYLGIGGEGGDGCVGLYW